MELKKANIALEEENGNYQAMLDKEHLSSRKDEVQSTKHTVQRDLLTPAYIKRDLLILACAAGCEGGVAGRCQARKRGKSGGATKAAGRHDS